MQAFVTSRMLERKKKKNDLQIRTTTSMPQRNIWNYERINSIVSVLKSFLQSLKTKFSTVYYELCEFERYFQTQV